MPKTDTTATPDPRDVTIRELEESNASLAQRVGELEEELAAARAQTAAARAETTATRRDLDGCREAIDRAAEEIRVRDAKLAQRSDELSRAQRQVDDLREDCARVVARRESGAPLALDIAALLDLHRIAGSDSDRYLATARRLGNALVAQHDDDAAARSAR